MLFQNELVVRGLLVLTVQLLLGGSVLFFAYNLLKKANNKLTITSSAFFICWAGGYMLPAIFFFVQINPFSFVIYNLAIFIINLAHAFLVLFAYNDRFSKIEALYLVVYGILAILVLLIPFGISYSLETNWVPIFSWLFSIVMLSVYTIIALLPMLYYIIRLKKAIYEGIVKKKLNYLFVGLIWMILIQYPVALYNTWIDNQIYRAFWSVFTYFNIIAFVLIFFGTRKEVE